MQLLNIGYDAYVQKLKIVLIMTIGSSGAKRLKDEAKASGRLIDSTQGHKARSIIVTSNDNVILSAVASDTLVKRNKKDNKKEASYG